MADTASEKSVIAALVVNSILTVVKFIAFNITGSGAMLSETIHSFADVMNQALLFVGIKRSKKTPDKKFHYGYGREKFVWALMSAVGIFFLGCGFTVMHGIEALQHPEELKSVGWALGVLSLSLVLDLSIFIYAFRSLWKQKGELDFLTFLKTEADPPEVAVLLEDGAATLGVLIAMSAIGATILFPEQPYWDAIGSILIGILLGVVAVWLIERNLKLLVGPSIPATDQKKVLNILKSSPLISSVQTIRTQALDTQTFDVEVDITMSAQAIADELTPTCQAQYPELTALPSFPRFKVDYTHRVIELIGTEVDRIESELTKADPAFQFVDIEVQTEET